MGAADQVIAVAMAQRGKKYIFGTAGPNTFDCSGLVVYAYKNGAGISLPHFTGTLWGKGSQVSKAQLAPGDLVFPNPSHVGIYIGGGQMVVAPHTGTVVQVQKVSTVWGARRIIAPGSAVGSGPSTVDVSIPTTNVGVVDDLKGIKDVFSSLNDIAGALANPQNWVRFGIIAAGALITMYGIWKFDNGRAVVQSGASAVKAVANAGTG